MFQILPNLMPDIKRAAEVINIYLYVHMSTFVSIPI